MTVGERNYPPSGMILIFANPRLQVMVMWSGLALQTTAWVRQRWFADGARQNHCIGRPIDVDADHLSVFLGEGWAYGFVAKQVVDTIMHEALRQRQTKDLGLPISAKVAEVPIPMSRLADGRRRIGRDWPHLASRLTRQR